MRELDKHQGHGLATAVYCSSVNRPARMVRRATGDRPPDRSITRLEAATVRLLLAGALASGVTALPGASGAASAHPSSQGNSIIVIEGKRNPELIPEWVAWRHALRLIGETRERRSGLVEFIESDLGLDDADLLLVRAAAKDHLEREARAREWGARLGPDPPASADGHAERKRIVRAYEAEFRFELLTAADKLLAALSPSASQRVLDWVMERKAGMTVTVLKADLDWFRWPR